MTSDRSKIIKDFKNKITILKKHNHYYYNKNKPRYQIASIFKLKKFIFDGR